MCEMVAVPRLKLWRQPQQLRRFHLCIQHAVKLQVHGGLALAQAALAMVGRPRAGHGLAGLPAGMSRRTGPAAPLDGVQRHWRLAVLLAGMPGRHV